MTPVAVSTSVRPSTKRSRATGWWRTSVRELPAGTVTFLFTDIEGSTRLLDELGDGYAEVLAEHRRALREAFAAYSGVEVDTQGDAFFVAFARSSDALAAAEAGQRALDGGPVRVRMGLHTGEPTMTEEGYVGADVHLAARVMGAGHGGQVLVSEATARLVEAELRDLGEHRLKDIERPVRLFQLGDARFPPRKTLNNSNLPLSATPLLGRKKELADVLRLLRVERARLMTVTGPGGIGKTRFALEAAHELVEEFAHGVWFVDLSALRDPALVAPSVAAALGAKGNLAEHVAEKRLLLVLDNFEQVVEAATEVGPLLRSCPNVQLLATSREPLHLAGERAYPLKPLAESPAVQLFRERAEAADPDFEAPWETLTAIVGRLDRLPLALELAASRVRSLSSHELLSRLDKRLPLLTTRARDVSERQRTLRATVEWSYELLDDDERSLFARLAVFAGGWTLAAGVDVCDTDVDALDALVDKSLVLHRNDRYAMLDTIWELAGQKLDELEENSAVRFRHAEHYAVLSERAGAEMDGLDVADALDVLARDQDNLRAALAWSFTGGDAVVGQRVCVAAFPFWLERGFLTEAARWLDDALAATSAAQTPPALEAELLYRAGMAALFANDPAKARSLYARSLALYRRLDDRQGVALALLRLADVSDPRTGMALIEEGLALARAEGEPRVVVRALHYLGQALRNSGDLVRGRALLEESVALSRRTGNPISAAYGTHSLGELALDDGRPEDAARLLTQSLREASRLGSQGVIQASLAGLAGTSAAKADDESAARLWGAAAAMEERDGVRALAEERDRWHERVAAACERSPEGLARGRAMPLVDAVELALSLHSR
jgi:predicted ATPase/class 3 adenylate cyclase